MRDKGISDNAADVIMVLGFMALATIMVSVGTIADAMTPQECVGVRADDSQA